ncbi:MAG: cytochrome C [Usitatibacteraceae bacterium]
MRFVAKSLLPLLAAALTFAASAYAQSGVDVKAATHVGETYACLECHNPTLKILGPSFKDIAAKYRDDKTAMDVLAAKVRKGGVGVWGQIAMPPAATIKEEELKLMLTWILSH